MQEQATIAAHAIKTEFFRPATVSEICTRLITAFLLLTPEDLGKIIFLLFTPEDLGKIIFLPLAPEDFIFLPLTPEDLLFSFLSPLST